MTYRVRDGSGQERRISMADHLSSERGSTRSPSLSRGILLGLLPLIMFISSIMMMYLAGYCGNGLVLLLQEVAAALWGAELLAGLLCLFTSRLRSLAIGLILTLLFSVLVAWLLEQLSFWFAASGPAPLCHFRN
jgi:hypothetical protein